MSKRSIGVLVLVNVVLLAALFVLGFASPRAYAQLGRGEYMIIAGEVTGRSSQSAVYLVDLRNQAMAALLFDTRNNRLQTIAVRRINDDLSVTADR